MNGYLQNLMSQHSATDWRHWLQCFALCCVLAVVSGIANAEQPSPSNPVINRALDPFSAEYRIHVSKIPTPIKAVLSLRPLDDKPDHFEMAMVVDSLLLKNQERSTFIWRGCTPQSQHYLHTFRGFGVRRQHDMLFDWQAQTMTYSDRKNSGTIDIAQDTLDEVTMLLRAQCLLAAGEREFVLHAAYGDRIRRHHFVVSGEQRIKTPVGEVDTIVIEKRRREDSERRTIFWIAPSMNYMLVQAKHIESRGLFGDLVMRRYQGPLPDQASGILVSTEESDEAPELAEQPSP